MYELKLVPFKPSFIYIFAACKAPIANILVFRLAPVAGIAPQLVQRVERSAPDHAVALEREQHGTQEREEQNGCRGSE